MEEIGTMAMKEFEMAEVKAGVRVCTGGSLCVGGHLIFHPWTGTGTARRTGAPFIQSVPTQQAFNTSTAVAAESFLLSL